MVLTAAFPGDHGRFSLTWCSSEQVVLPARGTALHQTGLKKSREMSQAEAKRKCAFKSLQDTPEWELRGRALPGAQGTAPVWPALQRESNHTIPTREISSKGAAP